MMHDHSVAARGIGDNGAPCRLCDGEDEEALALSLAAALWDSRQTGDEWDRTWDEAGSTWQYHFLTMARVALGHLRG
jgi:hypothetical protein